MLGAWGNIFNERLKALREAPLVIGIARGIGLKQAVEWIADCYASRPALEGLSRSVDPTGDNGLSHGNEGATET